jgi:hypothetical protein
MKKSLLVILLLVLLMPLAYHASAQGCAICTKTAAGLGEKSARGLNGGILYLAAIPLTLLGSIGFIWWKHNKNN